MYRLKLLNYNDLSLLKGRTGMENLKDFLTDVFEIFYQNAGASLLFAFMAMCIVKYVSIYGSKIFREWFHDFRNNKKFRFQFFFFFYLFIILFQTLFRRKIWDAPLYNVFGGWQIFSEDGTFNKDVCENLIMFFPCIILLFAAFPRALTYKCSGNAEGVINIFIKSVLYSLLMSLCIELLQLIFRFGTFQFSDITYNMIGGTVGGIIYLIFVKIRKPKKI